MTTTSPNPTAPTGSAARGWWALWPGLAAMALLGSSVAVIDATRSLPVFAVQSARYAVAVVAIVVFARIFRVRLVLPRLRDLGWVLGGAATGLVGFNLATLVGTAHAEPAFLGAAVGCIPLVLALAAPLAAGRRPAPRLIVGAIVVSAGAIAVTGWGRADPLGVLMGLALVAGEVGLTLFGARALPRMGAWSYSAATCAVAAIVFGVLSAVTEHPEPAVLSSPTALAAIAYLGAIATALAFVLWFTGVGRMGAAAAGLCAGTAAPAAALIAAALGAPLPSPGAWLGMAAIALGLVIGFAPSRGERLSRSRRRTPAPPAP
ncbi:DMT family transporter [Agromyces soli]|uniref:DMT family transporter n=1 Tax=Agromyces soli TaxID=659012 RepID=A0ABY4ATI1_9MICO|nr:DMT family transporter [Agromyces soli]UOE25158.1 DMT family transporter [Agromyces soli]